MTLTEEIKARFPILEQFRLDGHEFRKVESRFVCLCPLHQEKTPSCYVNPDSGRFHCFGCGEDGTIIDYFALTRRIKPAEAIAELALRLRVSVSDNNNKACLSQKRTQRVDATPRPLPKLRDLRQGTSAELAELSDSRHISIAALRLASCRGFLRFFNRHGHRAWVISDRQRRNIQARRCDGGACEHIGGKKAWTLPGCRAAWPIGIEEARQFKCIMLMEGGPDFLAAFHFLLAQCRVDSVAPVAILGASNRIPDDALNLFAGKRVRMFPHADSNGAGIRAAAKWETQLRPVAAIVDAFDFTGLIQIGGSPVSDLNDLTNVDADCFESEPDLRSMMNF